MKKPGVLTGALVSVMLTAPLIAVFYLGWKLLGLSFAPFDVFDWMVRIVPGPVVTFGIDSMVSIFRRLGLGNTADAAKTVEQIMAVALFFAAGLVAGVVLFAALRAFEKFPLLFGFILGAMFGAPVSLINHNVKQTAITNPLINGLWILAAFLTWGAAFGWAYKSLCVSGDTATREDESASVERTGRRQFLIRMGGATAAITVVGAVVGSLVGSRREIAKGERWSANNPLPNAGAAVAPAPGTRPEFTSLEDHYRIDINTLPPMIDEKDWRLKVSGLVERPVELALDNIRSYEPMHQLITLSCISNPVAGDLISTTRWTGVSLQQLLPDLGLKLNATHLKIGSADGFYEVVALETINNDERVMLTYAWDGVPLPSEHGSPLRVYIPDLYGMKQPKWIESIEALDHWEAGYWVARGWDREAQMKATSVIDTIDIDTKITGANGERLVPIGGITHAGARSISKVEVRVDDGEWCEAQLRAPLSSHTWVIWRYDFPFQEGAHTFTVRCYDGNGKPQIVEPSPPHPSGASGLHSK